MVSGAAGGGEGRDAAPGGAGGKGDVPDPAGGAGGVGEGAGVEPGDPDVLRGKLISRIRAKGSISPRPGVTGLEEGVPGGS